MAERLGSRLRRWARHCGWVCAWAVAATAQAQAPQRVVSLLPSLTETVCALGACERLVGVDRYSNWPPRVRHLPSLGGGLDPNVEAIAALQPDLVLVARSARVLPRLQALGLRVEVLEPQTHADVQRINARVAEVLGLPATRADALWADIQNDLAQARSSLPAAAEGWRVYFEVNDAPYAAGPESFIGETMTQLGLRNVVPAAWGAFARVSLEWVVAQQPDVVLVGSQGAAQLPQRPGWAQLQAMRQQRVCVFPPDQADVLVRAGPRMGQGARLIADCLQRVLTP
jgi:iron complex transport system substrate-binding protein